MRILVTRGDGLLAESLIRALATHHEVRRLEGDPRDREIAAAAADCDAVVHLLAPVGPETDATEALDSATRGTYNLITTTRARRFVLVSSLRLFERYDPTWRVTEQWAPRPTTDVADLVPFLAESTVREVAHVAPLQAIALRLGEVVAGPSPDAPANPRWLHVEDAVQAIERALTFEPDAKGPQTGWWVFHIAAGQRSRWPLAMAGQAPFAFAPRHDLTADAPLPLTAAPTPAPERFTDRIGGAARRVAIFGAGGPLAAVTTEALAHDHTLRLTDVRPLAEIAAEGKPQSSGAPLPRLLPPPHEHLVVDVADAAQVLDAARNMDALINCTVVRPHPVQAFRVNTLGAYHVMRAAVAHGIRRVVHTGPQLVTLPYPAGYWYDFAISPDVPPRPGDGLYGLSKFLGQEICRIFAEEHDLEVPVLLFSSFVNPTNPAPEPLGAFAFSISWEDAAAAMRQALRVPSLPRPYEILHIVADLPHGKYPNDKAKRLLGWQPRDTLFDHWRRDLA